MPFSDVCMYTFHTNDYNYVYVCICLSVCVLTEIFSSSQRNCILQTKPSIIHFDGYQIGQVHQQILVGVASGSKSPLSMDKILVYNRICIVHACVYTNV